MKNSLMFILFLTVFIIHISCAQEFDTYKVKGSIHLIRVDDFLTLRAQALNQESFFINDLNYNFVVLKKGSSGNYSKNNQSSDFSLKPKEEKRSNIVGPKSIGI